MRPWSSRVNAAPPTPRKVVGTSLKPSMASSTADMALGHRPRSHPDYGSTQHYHNGGGLLGMESGCWWGDKLLSTGLNALNWLNGLNMDSSWPLTAPYGYRVFQNCSTEVS